MCFNQLNNCFNFTYYLSNINYRFPSSMCNTIISTSCIIFKKISFWCPFEHVRFAQHNDARSLFSLTIVSSECHNINAFFAHWPI